MPACMYVYHKAADATQEHELPLNCNEPPYTFWQHHLRPLQGLEHLFSPNEMHFIFKVII